MQLYMANEKCMPQNSIQFLCLATSVDTFSGFTLSKTCKTVGKIHSPVTSVTSVTIAHLLLNTWCHDSLRGCEKDESIRHLSTGIKAHFQVEYNWYNIYMTLLNISSPTIHKYESAFFRIHMVDTVYIWSAKYIFTTDFLELKHIFPDEYGWYNEYMSSWICICPLFVGMKVHFQVEYDWYNVYMTCQIYIHQLFAGIKVPFSELIQLIQCIYDLPNIYIRHLFTGIKTHFSQWIWLI